MARSAHRTNPRARYADCRSPSPSVGPARLALLLDELLADTNSGHNIIATVFVQARAMVRAEGPVEMQPVGETEFVNGVAAMSASGIYGKTRHCAGIVGHADLTLGSRVEPVLAAHI